jgi:hypothetical protein
MENFARYHNPKIASLIMAVPQLSKFLYHPLDYVNLNDKPEEDMSLLTPEGIQTKLQLAIELQKIELQEFLDIIRVAEKNLILVTAPINLEIPPKKVCENTESNRSKDLQAHFKQAIANNKSKEIYGQLNDYAQATVANAMAFHLLGLAQLELGKFVEARQSLLKAAAFDCKFWRVNPTFNQVIRQKALENGITIVDLETMINQRIGKDVLFLDQHIPQDIYFEQMIEVLSSQIKKMLNL